MGAECPPTVSPLWPRAPCSPLRGPSRKRLRLLPMGWALLHSLKALGHRVCWPVRACSFRLCAGAGTIVPGVYGPLQRPCPRSTFGWEGMTWGIWSTQAEGQVQGLLSPASYRETQRRGGACPGPSEQSRNETPRPSLPTPSSVLPQRHRARLPLRALWGAVARWWVLVHDRGSVTWGLQAPEVAAERRWVGWPSGPDVAPFLSHSSPGPAQPKGPQRHPAGPVLPALAASPGLNGGHHRARARRCGVSSPRGSSSSGNWALGRRSDAAARPAGPRPRCTVPAAWGRPWTLVLPSQCPGTRMGILLGEGQS